MAVNLHYDLSVNENIVQLFDMLGSTIKILKPVNQSFQGSQNETITIPSDWRSKNTQFKRKLVQMLVTNKGLHEISSPSL